MWKGESVSFRRSLIQELTWCHQESLLVKHDFTTRDHNDRWQLRCTSYQLSILRGRRASSQIPLAKKSKGRFWVVSFGSWAQSWTIHYVQRHGVPSRCIWVKPTWTTQGRMLFPEEGRDTRQTNITDIPPKRPFIITYSAGQRGRREEEVKDGVPTMRHIFFFHFQLLVFLLPSFISSNKSPCLLETAASGAGTVDL